MTVPDTAPVYATTLDRVGLAFGVGGVLGGMVALALVMMGGQRDPVALALAWLLGAVFSAIGIAAVGGPVWLAFHAAGLRRAPYAALAGAIVAMLVFVGGQTFGFGFFEMPPMERQTLAMRWASALATSAVMALVAAAMALAMWRVAYRRVA